MRTNSCENDFDLHENGREGGTHFHINGFARGLVLKQRQRVNVLLNEDLIARLFHNTLERTKCGKPLNASIVCVWYLPILYNRVLWPGIKTSSFRGSTVLSHYHQVSTGLHAVLHIHKIIELHL